MKNRNRILKEAAFSIGVLVASFGLNLLMQELFHTRSLIPAIFVLGVFIISWRTQGYFWGVASSLVSVLAVNYAFTFPYYAFDLITPECVASAIVMLIVSTLTGTLTTQIKRQEQIKAEIERERMRANLLRAISHDLRTPLTSIHGATSAMIENRDVLKQEQQVQLLQDIREDSQWLIRMVENLLSVTRIDTERVKVIKTPTVLEELIDAVLVKFKKHYPHQNVQLQLPDDFLSIPMDAVLMEQVLFNLLENAVIHAKGMVNLSLSVTSDEGKAVFRVTDDGCGIPQDRLEDLFTGYMEQKTSPADGSRHNMGIGLSVCATIVKAHGGEICVKNRKPKGAEFYFALETEDEHEYQQI